MASIEFAQSLGFQAAQRLMPNQPIVAIETQFVFVDVAILLIDGTEQNGAMQALEPPAAAKQLAGQPIEQFGMEGGSPRVPKSLGVATRPRPR